MLGEGVSRLSAAWSPVPWIDQHQFLCHDSPGSHQATIHMVGQQQNLPLVTFNITGSEAVPVSPPYRCAHLTGTVTDGQKGKLWELDTIYCTISPNNAANWLSTAFITTVPVQLADKERATLRAIAKSFKMDGNVANREAAQIAAPSFLNASITWERKRNANRLMLSPKKK